MNRIIIDTREQKPLWRRKKESEVMRKKLDEGDYTTEKLYNKAHVERKSGSDLYGSIIQGHDRFKRELIRAMDKNIKLDVFVECGEQDFYCKKFWGGHRLKVKPQALARIVKTMSERYNINFHWCSGRIDMEKRMVAWFNYEESKLKC